MELTIEQVKLILSILNFMGLVFGFFYVRWERKDTATNSSIVSLRTEITKRMDAESLRVSNLEIELSRIPDRAEFDAAQERGRHEILRIHERIDEINSGIKQSQLMIGELIGLSKGSLNGRQ